MIKNEVIILIIAVVITLSTFLIFESRSMIPEQYPSIGFPASAFMGDMNAELSPWQVLENLRQAFLINVVFYSVLGNIFYFVHWKFGKK